ncbi:hypothetical protein JXB02_02835 [Candidatus Woesearchaeota archaeon]|nr:hypothetical protein [Candidatus Woesearchaeota archaeon]
MRKSSSQRTVQAILVAVALIMVMRLASAVPPIPASFSGTLTIDGANAPPGTNVSAFDPDGVMCGQFISTVVGFYGLLDCEGDDTDTGPDEGAEDGDTITFYVDGDLADAVGSTTWTAGGFPVANLNAQNDPPTISSISGLSGTVPAGSLQTVDSVTSDPNPTFGTKDQVRLIICTTNSASDGSGCDAATVCSGALAADDPSCSFNVEGSTGSWTRYVFAMDEHDEVSLSSRQLTYSTDGSPPSITGITPTNNSWQNATPLPLNVNTDENGWCKYDFAVGIAFAAKANLMTGGGSSAHDGNVALAPGNNDFYIQCNDTFGNVMALADEVHHRLRYDDANPTSGGATVWIDGGDPNSTIGNVYVNWTGFTDAQSGIMGYYYNTANNQGTIGGTYTANTFASMALPEGAAPAVYVWPIDISYRIGNAASDTIMVDLTPPTLSNWAESPPDLNSSSPENFTVSVTAADAVSGLNGSPQLRYRRGSYDSSYTSWQTMSGAGPSYSHTIPQPTGGWFTIIDEYVYYQVRVWDRVGWNQTTGILSERVNRMNYPPVFDAIGNKVAQEDELIWFYIHAADNDNDTLAFTSNLSVLSIATVNRTTANVSWTPGYAYNGDNHIYFTADDGTVAVNSSTVNIWVNATNDAPVLATIADQTVYVHEELSIQAMATDEDNETITYHQDPGSRSVFRIDPATGWINFTALLGYVGRRNVTIYASDGKVNDSENFTLTIYYCGDDICNTNENCSSCPQDCGSCSSQRPDRLAIVIQPRNCLNQTMLIKVYDMTVRANCTTMGLIYEGYEVCGNLSDVGLTISIKDEGTGTYNESAELSTDDLGEATFTPMIPGHYRIVAKKSDYPDTLMHFEADYCYANETLNETTAPAAVNQTGEPTTEPATKPPETEGPEEVLPKEETSLFLFILYYVIIPILLLSLFTASAWYYQKEKDNSIAILKARISVKRQYLVLAKYAEYYWHLLLERIGLGKK